MIDKNNLDNQEILYLYQGKVWVVHSYFSGSSVTMGCAASKEQISFGFGSLIDKAFKMIKEIEK